MALQVGHCFTSTSTCSSVFSKMMSIFVRRSMHVHSTWLKSSPHVSQVNAGSKVTVFTVRVLPATVTIFCLFCSSSLSTSHPVMFVMEVYWNWLKSFWYSSP